MIRLMCFAGLLTCATSAGAEILMPASYDASVAGPEQTYRHPGIPPMVQLSGVPMTLHLLRNGAPGANSMDICQSLRAMDAGGAKALSFDPSSVLNALKAEDLCAG